MTSEIKTAVAESAVTNKKLRLKVLVKKPANRESSHLTEVNCLKKPPIIDGRSKVVSGEKNLNSTLGTKHVIRACQFSKQVPYVNCFEKSLVTDNRLSSVSVSKKVNSAAGPKRRSEELVESHERKRLKMDRSATFYCQSVLAELMNEESSLPFHAPVKPADWGIYDYFDLIKNPMDLGTIRQKLQQQTYIGVEEFEADVRLTFSNAMSYNPPSNWCHEAAKNLIRVFDSLWKPVKMKMERYRNDIRQRDIGSSHNKTAYDVNGKCLASTSSQLDQLPGKALPRNVKSPGNSTKLLVGQCSDLKTGKDGNPKDLSSLRKHSNFSGKHTSTLQVDSYGHDFDGNLSLVNGEHGFATFPATTCSLGTAKGLETVSDVELSPSKALRVAKLKSRFAETIIKAQHHTLLEPGGEADKTIWQQEKEILLRRQHEEKAKIEAQVRAAKSAARLKAESELKRQRQEARDAARMATQQMEQSVVFDDNLQVLKDLEAITGNSLVIVCHDHRSRASVWSHIDSDKLSSPLERLGLYIKEEYRVGDDDDYTFPEKGDLEEGEIVC